MASSALANFLSIFTPLKAPTQPSKAPPSHLSLSNDSSSKHKDAFAPLVIVEDNEPEEKLLGRFRREVMKAGVIQECKRRRYFENKQEEKKRKTREAAKRNRRRRTPFRNPNDDKVESVNKKREDDDDNWDMPSDSPLN
ncbi:unnamed protein product [Lactuca virosa]|uniref:30S ribosomal protein S21, chloroplastic n=1 Tax=Lactuca virosa TaxID=75947 RepID=A0AAU9NJ60_9ASTR|nr:unnamed protein product [Lactuca virosa]